MIMAETYEQYSERKKRNEKRKGKQTYLDVIFEKLNDKIE